MMLKSVSKLRLLVDETRDAYLRGDVNYTIELDGIAERIEQEVSERYMEMPLDADGEVWHVGDFVVGEVNPRNPKAIERMIWYGPDSGWQLETDTIIYPCPDRPRHHHAPTVEDVLRDMLDSLDLDLTSHVDTGAVIAEYAEKLRLAGDGDES